MVVNGTSAETEFVIRALAAQRAGLRLSSCQDDPFLEEEYGNRSFPSHEF